MAQLEKIGNPFDRCLVENDRGDWFVYSTALKGSIMIMQKHQRTRYPNFKTFAIYHSDIAEDLLKKRWLELIKGAKDRVNLSADSDVNTRVEGKLELRSYKALPCPTEQGKTRFHLTAHTRAVYEFLEKIGKIQERELKKQFTQWYATNRVSLKAKQKDAWRFFQTHRPYLLKGGFLTIID